MMSCTMCGRTEGHEPTCPNSNESLRFSTIIHQTRETLIGMVVDLERQNGTMKATLNKFADPDNWLPSSHGFEEYSGFEWVGDEHNPIEMAKTALPKGDL